MATAPAAPPARRSDAARNRAAVLAAARTLLDEDPAALTMGAVARAAGVGTGTLYRHFPTRAHLVETLAGPALAALAERVRAASLDDAAHAVVAALVADRAVADALRAPDAVTAEGAAARAAVLGGLRRALVRDRAQRRLRRDVTVEDLLRLLCGAEHAAALGAPAVAGPAAGPAAGSDGDARRRRYVTVVLAGLADEG
ncbi:helix-turn-helix domain-containing protein [Cellulomonas marina]|uniref:Regulatory protein, tetR family n=1 Tax=Cellulomonas marina TaxID=988821 RepID=A0A1I0Y0T7_9CELL|nr:helix-turn-helix domain-containing protein [Cellulomonas marina]GIG28429.1 hypothetical protein Cma02nite_10290 [Cellulomonas marina]SFB06487.1 regulatory protein, tetR family [Cellulomonas marina]